MQKQDSAHLSAQIKARDPQLLVYWTGGNRLGYPSLRSRTGKSYKRDLSQGYSLIEGWCPPQLRAY